MGLEGISVMRSPRPVAELTGRRTVHCMTLSHDNSTALDALRTTIRRAETCSLSDLLVMLAVDRRLSSAPIKVTVRLRRSVAAES